MSRYIVMDIVFEGNSLNYDQGSGNYQELKKITLWDGRQHTLVSRYALRYSILQQLKRSIDDKVEGIIIPNDDRGLALAKSEGGGNKVIQMDKNLLVDDMTKYLEFDLFGYLVTDIAPQAARTAPVKISRAISLTPFNYDTQFSANIWYANRMARQSGDIKPNPITIEEHKTYYNYTVIIDYDQVGKIDIYLKTKEEKKNEINKKNKDLLNKIKDKSEIQGKFGSATITDEYEGYVKHISWNVLEKVKKERIKQLIKSILNLKRDIKGRSEDLSPKLLILGLYENEPYKTYKDKIELTSKDSQEIIEEITERDENGTKVVRRLVKIEKTKKPAFRIHGLNISAKEINENDIIGKITSFLEGNESESTENGEQDKPHGVYAFYSPEVEIIKDSKDN